MNLALAGVEKKTTTRINTDFTLEQNLSFLLKGLKASFTISWDNQFLESRRGINDTGNSAQQKWINPETGEVTYKQSRWVLIIIFFEILIPPEPFMRDAPHFFYRKYNKNLL